MDGLTHTSQILPPAPNPTVSGKEFAGSKSISEETRQSEGPQQSEGQGPLSAVQDVVRAKQAKEQSKDESSPDVKDLIKQLEKLAENLHLVDNTRLAISFREDVNKFVYQGIDRDTGEVVTEYPSEEVLDMISNFRELTGLSVDFES